MHFKEAREAKKMSQKFVALTLGVKPPNVSRWEAGVTFPAVENLIKLAELYEVTTDYLLGLDDIPLASRLRGVNSYDESILLQIFRQLTPEDRDLALRQVETFLQRSEYQKETFISSAV